MRRLRTPGIAPGWTRDERPVPPIGTPENREMRSRRKPLAELNAKRPLPGVNRAEG